MGYKYSDGLGNYLNETNIIQSIGNYYDFSNDVFLFVFEDLYGEVDSINAILTISPKEELNDGNAVLGECHPGEVIIFLYNILKYNRITDIISVLVNTIIHELMHLGQTYNTYKEIEESGYSENRLVEMSVEYETDKYITVNRERIEQKFGVCINTIMLKKDIVHFGMLQNNLYQPCSHDRFWIDIIVRLLDGIKRDSAIDFMNALIEKDVINSNKDVVLIVESDEDNPSRYENISVYIKKDNRIQYPDDDCLYSIKTICSSSRTVMTGCYYDNEVGVHIVAIKYKVILQSPLIKEVI